MQNSPQNRLTPFKLAFALTCAAGAAVRYFAKKPVQMHRYTLTNGDRTIIFQEMMHLAHDSFYDQVLYDLAEFKRSGFTVAYERVHGTEEENQELCDTLGLPEGYVKQLAPILGLSVQSCPRYWNSMEDTDINADMSVRELIDRAQALGIRPVFQAPANMGKFFERLSLNSRQQEFAHGLIRLSLHAYPIMPTPPQMQDVMELLLDRRNEKLFEIIQVMPQKRVLIHYGKAHFPGWWSLMQKHDPHWSIIEDIEYTAL